MRWPSRIDALSDALTAETAYQMVRGNVSRTAARWPPWPRATRRRPSSKSRARRAPASRSRIGCCWLQRRDCATPGWAGASTSPRAAAEPMLNAWAARLLGDPRKVRCRIEAAGRCAARRSRSHDAEAGRAEAGAAGCRLRRSNAQAAPGQALNLPAAIDPQALGEIEQRLLLQLRSAVPELAEDARLRIVRAARRWGRCQVLTLRRRARPGRSGAALLAAARRARRRRPELPRARSGAGRSTRPSCRCAQSAPRTVLLAAHNALRRC